jgi:hypothetical protein
MRLMQAKGAAAGRGGTRPAVGRDRRRKFAVWYRRSSKPRSRSKKGLAALTLAAGAGGLAVAKRRRSAAANEPLGQIFPVDDKSMVTQGGVADRSAEEASTAHAPDAQGSNAASKGGGASKDKRGVA